MSWKRWEPYRKHLRIPYALTLAPIFLWGLFLSQGRFSLTTWLCFAAFHLFLYPGVTAYNSAYDRDTGPVGGMRQPPPVPPRLHEFSFVVMLLGATLVPPKIIPIYVAYALLGIAYSHPAIRLKAHPVGSALAVSLGQGGLACSAGWVAGGGGSASNLAFGVAIACLTTLGLYPVGQTFQVEEDSARGDRTLAVVLGPAGALRFGAAMLVLAGTVATCFMGLRFTSVDAALIFLAYGIATFQVLQFAERFAAGTATEEGAFVTSSRLTWTTSAAFLIFVLGHWIR